MEKGMDSDDEAVILRNFKSSNAPPRGCREPLEGGDGIKGSQTARKSAPSAANSFTASQRIFAKLCVEAADAKTYNGVNRGRKTQVP